MRELEVVGLHGSWFPVRCEYDSVAHNVQQIDLRNTSDSEVGEWLAAAIEQVLPATWRAAFEVRPGGEPGSKADIAISVSAPNGTESLLLVELKRTSRASAVRDALAQVRAIVREPVGRPATGVVVAPYLSASVRREIADAGCGYLDATGNLLIRLDEPALYVSRQGADRNPQPDTRGLKKLKGAGAMDALRALLDWHPPYGIRQLARLADITPSTITRVVDLLEVEGVVERSPDGGVQRVAWRDLLDRWAADYSLVDSNNAVSYLAPRGLAPVLDALQEVDPESYAITGTRAVPEEATVAPPANLVAYGRSVTGLAEELDLVPNGTSPNVVLLRPLSDVVFERTRTCDDLTCVAISQAAIDLLTGPGRGPSEAEALLAWMAEREGEWRASP